MNHTNFIQTFNGNFFDFDDMDSNNIDIDDIAHSLANQCRWSGHVKWFYSVAQHSLNATAVARNAGLGFDIQFEALMHDSSEAIVVDLPRPLKRLCPDYCAINENVERFMAKRFGYSAVMSPEVREIDDRLLVTEYHALIDVNEKKRFLETNLVNFNMDTYNYKNNGVYLSPTKPFRSKAIFLHRFAYLQSKLSNQA